MQKIFYRVVTCLLLASLLWAGCQLRDNGKRAVSDQDRMRELEDSNKELKKLSDERLTIIGELENTIGELDAERDRRTKAIDGIESSTGSIERIIETVKKRGFLVER